MDIDLYKDDLTAASDADLFTSVEVYAGAAQEGYLLDFKAAWSDSALKTVAAFANTFGGLLIVGVSESGGRADQLVGIPSQRQEIKTTIASSIASNISPAPPYEIRDVVFPDGAGKHLCLVGVRKGNSLYLLTKKNEQPVYIRNEDQSLPADAARLQALLASRISGVPAVYPPASDPPGFYVSELNVDPSAQRRRSETFLQLQIVPEEVQAMPLDLAVEQKIQAIVRGTYPGLSAGSFSEVRNRYWYQITYLDAFSDYEMRWGITNNGVLHFITQIAVVQRHGSGVTSWSLSDLMTNLDCTIQAVHQLWAYMGYLGAGRVLAAVRIQNLPLLKRTSGSQGSTFAFGYYGNDGPRRRARPLTSDLLTKA